MASFFRSLLIAIPTFCFSSCSSHSKDKELISLLKDQLEQSGKNIGQNTTVILKSLADKSTDPMTREKASLWLPKAEKISQLADSANMYLERLKKKGRVSDDDAIEIEKKLKEFSTQLLNVDQLIKLEFEHNQFLSICSLNKLPLKKETAHADFIKSLSPGSSTAMLTNIQNNIRLIESKTIAFCYEQVGSTGGCGFSDSYLLLVGQSSNSVSAGSQIEITAGIGAFSKAAQPDIRINKKKIAVNENGYSFYKFKTPKEPGVYKTPVELSYFDRTTGKKEDRIVMVEYTVTPPCN